MYKQIYTIPFKSVEENSYNIVIEKKGYIGISTELVGASKPFVVEDYADFIFNPFKLSSATLSIYGGDYLRELFTPDPQGVRVKLLKNGNIEWVGFITNDTYSQDYSNSEFVYEIELINPISTLKYIKYESNLKIITFIQLIKDAVEKANAEIKTLYLPSSYTDSSNNNIYNLIKVLSNNFFDEQNEPMSYYEILEEIAKYLCLTISVKGDSVYFIDYTGIGKGFNGYYKYNLTTGSVTSETLYHTTSVQNLDYASNSSSLQINSGRNKVKAICSLYNIDSAIMHRLNKNGMMFLSSGEYIEVQKKDSKTAIEELYSNVDNTGFETYLYFNPNPNMLPLGSSFVGYAQFPTEEPPLQLNTEPLIIVDRGDTTPSPVAGKKILTMWSKGDIVTTGEEYFILNYDYRSTYHSKYDLFDKGGMTYSGDQLTTIDAEIKYGNLYYNGTGWQTTPTKFSTKVVRKDNEKLSQWTAIKNDNDYKKRLGGYRGMVIKAPDGINIGNIEFTLYSTAGSLIGRWEHFRNIELNIAKPEEKLRFGSYIDENTENDIIYENDIDSLFEEEVDDIELKICTYPDDYNRLCYSSTFISNKHLKSLKYNPLGINDKPEIILIKKIMDYYKEPKYQLTIPVNNKTLYPYSVITDSNITSKRFIYAGSEIDYEYEMNTINILEI